MFKLVLHISDLDKWQVAINNVKNSIAVLQIPFKITVIANVKAVQGYLDSHIRTQINALIHPDITFMACQNSLNGQDITLEMLNPADRTSTIAVTPVAVIALVEYQNAGFAYIKP